MVHVIEHPRPSSMIQEHKVERGNPGTYTRDVLVRAYAQVVSFEKFYEDEIIDWVELREQVRCDGHVEEDVPDPLTSLVVIRAGWVRDCLDRGKVLDDENYGGWIVK